MSSSNMKNILNSRAERKATVTDLNKYNIGSPFKSGSNHYTTGEIPVDRVIPFASEQPFVDYTETEKFDALAENIEEHGLANPISVFVNENGLYEVISGHHRLEVFKRLKRATIPAFVFEDMSREDATIAMLNGNILQGRDKLSFAEEARALRIYSDTLERKRGVRTDLDEDDGKVDVYSQLQEYFGLGSRTTVVRYIRAERQAPREIIEKVGIGLPFSVLYEILKIRDNELKDYLYKYILRGDDPSLTVPIVQKIKEDWDREKEKEKASIAEKESVETSVAEDEWEDDSESSLFYDEDEGVYITTEPTESPSLIDNFRDVIEIIDKAEKEVSAKKYVYKCNLDDLPERVRKMEKNEINALILDLLIQWDKGQRNN